MTEEDGWRQNSNEVYVLAKNALNELRDDWRNEKLIQNSSLPVSKNIVSDNFIMEQFFKLKILKP